MREQSARERGQGTVEYVGMVLAVVALVTVLLLAIPSLGRTVTCAIERAFTQSGGCSGPVEVVYGGKDQESHEGGGTSPDAPDRYDNATNPRAVNKGRVAAALQDVRDALDGGFFGVREGDLAAARDAVQRLNGAEIDALIAQMSDAELEHWVRQLNDGWLFGGWSSEQRRELWNLFASQASKGTLDRLAHFTDELQPGFDRVGDEEQTHSPRNQGRYGELQHQLFIDGPDPQDVAQGALGDCWWVASMMAVAQADPTVIEEAITANPNGSYTVRLFDDGRPVFVTVTPDMVLDSSENPFFVNNDVRAQDHELWPMVLEKALALHYGDFHDIEGGWPSVGMSTLTGVRSSTTNPGSLSLAELRKTLDDGGAIGLASLPEGAGSVPSTYRSNNPLIHGHAYYIQDVDVAHGTVTVVNPWGINRFPPRTLTYDEFVSSFQEVYTNEVHQ